ncbi:hypothetical protein RQN30_10180 [Arcanobacterium hippocoleae]
MFSANELSQRLDGAVSALTLRRWAAAGRIKSSYKLLNGRIMFTDDAVAEILQPLAADSEDSEELSGSFSDVPLPGMEECDV